MALEPRIFTTRADYDLRDKSAIPVGTTIHVEEDADVVRTLIKKTATEIVGEGKSDVFELYDTVINMIATDETARGVGSIWEAGGFRFIEAETDADDFDLILDSDVKLYITATGDGWVCPEQFGVQGTPDLDGAITAAIKSTAIDGTDAERAAAIAPVVNDSDPLSLMADYGRKHGTLKARFKPNTIYGSVRPWTFRHMRNLLNLEGYGAKWVNLRASLAGGGTDLAAVNYGAMIFEGHYIDQDPTTEIDLPIRTDSGGPLASAENDTIVMKNASDMLDFKVGGRFKIFGFCLQGQGSPQITRHFEYGTIKAIDGLTITTEENLSRGYDPQWPLIGTRGPTYTGKPEFNGPPFVLSLDRGMDRFIETERMIIRGLEFLPNPMWTAALATVSRNGRLTAGGARYITLEDISTPASIYSFSSEKTEMINPRVDSEVEIDKFIKSWTLNGGHIGSALQGSGCKEVLLTGGASIGALQIPSALDRYTFDGVTIHRPHLSTVAYSTTSGVPYLDVRSVTFGRAANTQSWFGGIARNQAFTIEPDGRLKCPLVDLREGGAGHPFLRHVELGGIIFHNEWPAYYVDRIYQDVEGGPDVFFDVTPITLPSVSGFTSGDLLSAPAYRRIDIGRHPVTGGTGRPLPLYSTVFNQNGVLTELHDGRRSEGLSSSQYPFVPANVAFGLHPLGGPFLITSIEVNVTKAYTGPTTNGGYLLRSSTNNLLATIDLFTAGRRILEPGGQGLGGDVIHLTGPTPASVIAHASFVPLQHFTEADRPIYDIIFHGRYLLDSVGR